MILGLLLLLVVMFQPTGLLGLFVTDRERIGSYGWRERGARRGDVIVLLEARGVGKTFGALRALDGGGLDRRIRQSFHGLIGPNGSGKSTLLKAIAGAHFASSGTIVFAGRDITTRSAVRARARRPEPEVPDHRGPARAVRLRQRAARAAGAGQILSGAGAVGHAGAPCTSAVMTCCSQRFRLDGARATISPACCRHGQQQWLEIAMALAREPKLLLLDEPTAGMSPQERRATGELLAPIKQHCSLLIVEHDLDFIKDICDTLTVLDQGQVVASGPTRAGRRTDKRVKEAYLS